MWLQRDFGIFLVNCFDTEKACQVAKRPFTRRFCLISNQLTKEQWASLGLLRDRDTNREHWVWSFPKVRTGSAGCRHFTFCATQPAKFPALPPFSALPTAYPSDSWPAKLNRCSPLTYLILLSSRCRFWGSSNAPWRGSFSATAVSTPTSPCSRQTGGRGGWASLLSLGA